MNNGKVYFATDHAGFEMKEALVEHVRSLGYAVEDLGAHEYDEHDDYPVYMHRAAQALVRDTGAHAVVLGGSGQGEAMVMNRYRGVRAGVYNTENLDLIRLLREHNNANALSLGARFISLEHAREAVTLYLQLSHQRAERHDRRIVQIDAPRGDEVLGALLLAEGGVLSTKRMRETLELEQGQLDERIALYNTQHADAQIIADGAKLLLHSAPYFSELIASMHDSEASAPLSKAATEVLAIVLYSPQGTMTSPEIDYVRGVNSAYSLRQLTRRGLLLRERAGAGYRYAPSAELYALLGVASRDMLPENMELRARIERLIDEYEQDNTDKAE